jgi:hypothetical protein
MGWRLQMLVHQDSVYIWGDDGFNKIGVFRMDIGVEARLVTSIPHRGQMGPVVALDANTVLCALNCNWWKSNGTTAGT